jgi:NADH dehydrogenase
VIYALLNSRKQYLLVEYTHMEKYVDHQTPDVIIVGGGFAGIATARKIALANKKINISLISDKSYFEYYPALYRVVTGAAPIEVCVPLADMVPKNVDIVVDRIARVNPNEKMLYGESGTTYSADFIVLGLGSQTTYFNLPGLPDLSFGFKSIGEAVRLKNHIEGLFVEHQHPSVSELISHFHIVIVGGGPSGVEVAGDLTAHLRKLAQKYKVDPSFITIDIIERNPRVLPSVEPKVSARALARLRKLGINVFLNRTLLSEEVESVYLKDMSLKSKTVIWTAGTQVSNVYTAIPGIKMTERKRVQVNEYLEMDGFENVYVVGDGANFYHTLAVFISYLL